jgi:hypothetical protein
VALKNVFWGLVITDFLFYIFQKIAVLTPLRQLSGTVGSLTRLGEGCAGIIRMRISVLLEGFYYYISALIECQRPALMSDMCPAHKRPNRLLLEMSFFVAGGR